MSTTTPITTINFTPSYYEKEYVPDALKATAIRVLPDRNDERFVTLSIDVAGEQRALIMKVCAAHAQCFADGYLKGMEMGYAVAEEIAADEAYERWNAK